MATPSIHFPPPSRESPRSPYSDYDLPPPRAPSSRPSFSFCLPFAQDKLWPLSRSLSLLPLSPPLSCLSQRTVVLTPPKEKTLGLQGVVINTHDRSYAGKTHIKTATTYIIRIRSCPLFVRDMLSKSSCCDTILIKQPLKLKQQPNF